MINTMVPHLSIETKYSLIELYRVTGDYTLVGRAFNCGATNLLLLSGRWKEV